MSEIKINTTKLDDEIKNLNNLKKIIERPMHKCPTTMDGGGKTIQELEEIGKLYKTIRNDMYTLVSSTSAFMKNINTSYKTADKKSVTSYK